MNQLRSKCIENRIEEEMGRVGQNPSSSSEPLTITHFSHIHPLQLFTPYYDQALASSSSCSGCNLKLQISSGDASSSIIYCCSGCNFFLHASCSKLPLQITHPVDQFHALSLLPTPIYPQGFFNCNACGKRGTGFSYHCGVCNLDLHSACASMPVSRIHPAHPHQLTLTFSPPYPNNAFSCDICRNPGTNHWLYRCHHCHFDSHLSCAAVSATSPMTLNHQQCQNTNVPQVNATQNYIIGYPSNMSVTQQRQPMATQPQYAHMTVNPMSTNNRQLLGSNSYGRSNPLQGLFRSGNSLVRGFLGGGIGGGGGGGGGGEMSDTTGGGFDTGGGGFDSGGGFDTGGGYGDTGSFGDVGSSGDFDFDF